MRKAPRGGHGALKGWLYRLRRSVTSPPPRGKQSCRAYLPSCAGSPSSRLVEVGGILPCASDSADLHQGGCQWRRRRDELSARSAMTCGRSEEHTSELQSRPHLVCRLLLEKKNTL